MRRIDAVFVARPFYGSRRIAVTLSTGAERVNRKRVQRLMRLMGIAALGPKPRTSRPSPGHKIYPYLLRNVAIERANQVWCADITYVPMRRGFLYLVAVMDWWSRAALSWRLSNTMDAGFCVAALEEALRRYGRPEVFNPTRAANSPVRHLSAHCSALRLRCRWIAAAAGWTTSSSSGCGARSSTKRFT